MLLVADIGNTSTTLGVYEGGLLVKSWRISSDKKRSADEYGVLLSSIVRHEGYGEKIKAAAVSSVVLPLTDKFKEAIEKYLKVPVFVVSAKTKTGVILDVEKPKEVGADRIANAYAAYKLHKAPAVVVDFGTATTFDVVSEDGRFIGGIIAPGIGISAEALSSFTSLLPKVNIEAPKVVIGRNTIDNMLSGLVRGHAAMIDGLMLSIEEELGMPVTKIATGGFSKMIENCMKKPFDFYNPDLTLEGIRLLYELNSSSVEFSSLR